jgi:hypothetical protein
MPPREDRELRLGFCKLHILHHAAKRPIYGLWMLQELTELHAELEELYREIVLGEETEHGQGRRS